MFSQFASFRFPTFNFRSSNAPKIDIPSVPIYDVETSVERRARTLKHLIKANHVNYSIIYHNLRFHNHTNHILGSAYILGATPEHLNQVYEKESGYHEPWRDSPGEISKEDWRDFLGKREYQRAFVDFFEDELVQEGYDYDRLLEDYLLKGDEPLINGLIGRLGHPLIHLGYAYELRSQTIGIEALALGACFYNSLHKYLDDPSYTKPSSYSSKDLLEILQKIQDDLRFDKLFNEPTAGNIDELLEKREAAVLDHWNAWDISDPKKQFEDSQKVAVSLLVGTQTEDSKYDFFLVHLLTTSHAVRILLPLLPPKFHIPLVRQWWFFTVLVYITQLRPTIKLDRIEKYDLKGRDWKFVEHKALSSKWAFDAHYVKALRSMKEAAITWGDDGQFYLKASVKFADTFTNWAGFGLMGNDEAYGHSV
ncbi:hypothetical protein M501DRAFT_997136 [Patellaria atrata CBS 101060]|uniref:MGS207 protein n=1 Tax=Patellaria atrata CBS 101060 TaxID=1346257 RepID=A0A9P4S575_9PEZI|nr:hypothetical protein M501DRAFT_997136 [Patellaria atrata CBS 101060]